ncbi:MAG: hypothetical protein HOV79_14855 [Hamadaea sp.]|nr:hypothetical protein [Hamadaea sp.]
MRLTWRDAVATGLVAGAVALFGAHLAGAHLPGLGAVRPIAAVVVALGLGACIVGAQRIDAVGPGYGRWMGVLGGAAVVTALTAVFGGFEIALWALTATTVGLWVTATVRHAFAAPAAVPPVLTTGISDRDLHDLIDKERSARR